MQQQQAQAHQVAQARLQMQVQVQEAVELGILDQEEARVSQSLSPIPGTPGADLEVPKYQHFVSSIDPAGDEPSNYDFVESLNPTELAAEFRHFVRHNPSTLSSQDIKAQLK
ncbi:hypothetical protein FRC06_001121 [Ceratobasidium sp. 370]|nr:hypothetical protein FRC06_001121 [Ceratobasidium sp. 370]